MTNINTKIIDKKNINKGMNEKWSTLVNLFLCTNTIGLVMLTYVTIMAMFESISYVVIPMIPLCLFTYFEYKLIKTKKLQDVSNLGFCLKVTLSIVGLLY